MRKDRSGSIVGNTIRRSGSITASCKGILVNPYAYITNHGVHVAEVVGQLVLFLAQDTLLPIPAKGPVLRASVDTGGMVRRKYLHQIGVPSLMLFSKLLSQRTASQVKYLPYGLEQVEKLAPDDLLYA